MERRGKHARDQSPKNQCPKVRVFNSQTALSIKNESVRKLIRLVLENKRVMCQEVSVYLVGKKKISSLHSSFFNDPSPTDCITFPMDESFLGEVFVCPQMACEYNPSKPYEEVTLYIIHGLLHLLGYEDEDSMARKKMRKEELRLMTLVRKEKCALECFLPA